MMGNESNMPFRAREQDRVKRGFQKIEGSNGTYVSKPGKGACMTSNLKTLHPIFLLTRYEKNPHYSPARLGTKKESLS